MFNRKIGTISKKIHTPYEGMFGLGGAQGYEKEVTGTTYIDLTNAIANKLLELKAYGGTEQNGTPAPDTPMDIVCNNGALKVSPNLFNKNLVPDANEYINKGNGNAASPTSGEFRHSDYITIKENTRYYVGIINSTANSAGLAFYDDTKTYISGISLTQLGNDDNIIRSPNNTKYIRFSFRTDEGYNTNWQNTVYLVEGNQPLAEFIPYGKAVTDGTTETIEDSLGNTATAEMLLKVGDYKDTQEVLTGSVTRNIGVKVLDGTEDWTYESQYSRFNTELTPPSIIQTTIRSIPAYCTHFKMLSNGEAIASITSGQGYIIRSAQSTKLYLHSDITSVENFSQSLADQYAAGTPVIIVYPLATPTTETVTGQQMNIQEGTNTIEITQASIDSLQLYAKYKSLQQ